jgi:polysaccharide pyruvyl transferase WcaK-like protein
VAAAVGVPRASFIDWLRCSHIILGGGGFFQRVDGSRGALRSLIKYGAPICIAKLFGKKTALVGVGIAPLPGPIARLVFRWLLWSSDIVVARDSIGCAYAKQLAPFGGSMKIKQGIDLAFDRSALDAVVGGRYTSANSHNPAQTTLVGIHLSTPSGFNAERKALLSALSRQLKEIGDYQINLIVDHLPSKEKIADATLELASFGIQAPTTVVSGAIEDIIRGLYQCDVIITTKLHVGICAVALGKDLFSIYKHTKNAITLSEVGLSDRCLSLDGVNESELSVFLKPLGHQASDEYALPPSVQSMLQVNRDTIREFLS